MRLILYLKQVFSLPFGSPKSFTINDLKTDKKIFFLKQTRKSFFLILYYWMTWTFAIVGFQRLIVPKTFIKFDKTINKHVTMNTSCIIKGPNVFH